MIRGLALLLAAIPLTSATPPDLIAVVNPQLALVKIECDGWMGTGFRIDDKTIVSVNHVVKKGNCSINAWPIHITHSAPNLDFAILQGNAGPALPVDCGGFVAGRKYLAIGYARDVEPATTVELTATGLTDKGEAVLTGMFVVIPGQSGGPIIDKITHRVVGTVNSENFENGLSWSVPLSATKVCRA